MNNERELNRYMKLTVQAANLLHQIDTWIGNHGDVAPDDVNQLHVNHMRQVVSQLEHINAAIEAWSHGVPAPQPVEDDGESRERKAQRTSVPNTKPQQCQVEPDGDMLWLA